MELFASREGNGISGYVAATGRSYICPDVLHDPRYIPGLDQARSSLTVPLFLHDKSHRRLHVETTGPPPSPKTIASSPRFRPQRRRRPQHPGFAGRRSASAPGTASPTTSVSDIAGPLNDISSDALLHPDDYIGHDDLRDRLQQIIDNVCDHPELAQPGRSGNEGSPGHRRGRGQRDGSGSSWCPHPRG